MESKSPLKKKNSQSGKTADTAFPKTSVNAFQNNSDKTLSSDSSMNSSSINNSVIDPIQKTPQRKRRFSLKSNINRDSITNLIILGIVGLALLTVFLFLPIYNSRNIRVYLLNGFDKSIKIKVNGEEYTVESYTHEEIRLPSGKHKFEVTGPIEKSIEIEIKAKYGQNISPHYFKAINPAGEAVLLKTTTTYYANTPPANHQDEYEYIWGEIIDMKKGADFMFEQFTESVEIDSNSEERTKLDFVYSNPLDQISYIYQYNGKQEALNYIEFYLNQETQKENEDTWLDYYFSYGIEVPGGMNRVETLAKKKLDAKETLQSHRTYQNSLEYQGKSKELRKQYDKYLNGELDGNLDKADYYYLRGRIAKNNSEAGKYYSKALGIDSRHAYANYAIGMINMNNGDYEEAVKYLEKAYKRNRDSYIFERYYLEALTAVGDWDELYSEIHKVRANYPTDFKLFEKELLALEMQNDKEGLSHQISEFNKIEKDFYGDQAIDYSNYADTYLAIVRNNPKDMSSDYTLSTGQYYSVDYHFIKLILEGNYVEAGKLYSTNEGVLDSEQVNLILATVFDLNNIYINPEKADDSYLEKFIESQEVYAKYEKSADLISFLKSDRIPTEEEIKEWEIDNEIRALLCYYYWVKSGGDAGGEDWLKDLSLKYSYNRNMVYHFIRNYNETQIEKM